MSSKPVASQSLIDSPKAIFGCATAQTRSSIVYSGNNEVNLPRHENYR